MSYYDRYYGGFAPTPTVAQLRAKGEKACAKLRKKKPGIEPVEIEGRVIAKTFWGKAWCGNLEAYRDFAYRLERGRKYVRHRCVLDLSIRAGRVEAVVQGSSQYKVAVKVEPLPADRWANLKRGTVGQIGSAIDLLRGELSDAVIEQMIDLDTGLFPKPTEIKMSCSCPDGAGCCKHVAAALYGVGHRLDAKPDLLFVLRGLDPVELIAHAASADALTAGGGDAVEVAGDALGDIFGIALDGDAALPVAPAKQAARRRVKAGRKKAGKKKAVVKKTAKKKAAKKKVVVRKTKKKASKRVVKKTATKKVVIQKAAKKKAANPTTKKTAKKKSTRKTAKKTVVRKKTASTRSARKKA